MTELRLRHGYLDWLRGGGQLTEQLYLFYFQVLKANGSHVQQRFGILTATQCKIGG